MPGIFVYHDEKITAPNNMPKKMFFSAAMSICNTDSITKAIDLTKRLYQKEMDLRAIECTEDEGMIVHQSGDPSNQNTGKLSHGSE